MTKENNSKFKIQHSTFNIRSRPNSAVCLQQTRAYKADGRGVAEE